MTWKNLCVKHDYDRRFSESNSAMASYHPPRPAAFPLVVSDSDFANHSFPGALPQASVHMSGSRSFDGASASSSSSRPKLKSYKSHFKQRYLVDAAWKSGGRKITKNITQDGGVVTSLHLTPKYIIVALDNAKIHVFDTEGNGQKTLQGHVMGVWAMVPWEDILVSGGCDRDVRVWDLLTGYAKPLFPLSCRLRNHTTNNTQRVPAHPPGPHVYCQVSQDVGSEHGHIRIPRYNLESLGHPYGPLPQCSSWPPS